jgi:hypothetical protein
VRRVSRTSWPLEPGIAHQLAARTSCELQLAARCLYVSSRAVCTSIDKHGPGQLLQLQLFGRPITASCSYSGLVLAGLVLADLVAVDLVAVDLVAVDLVAVDLVAVDLVAVDLVPRAAVRGPWRVSECPPTPGPKKRAGSLAALALALFYTVGFT